VSRLTCGHIQHMYSWWWVRLSPETWRVKPLRRIKTQLLHLVGLISLLYTTSELIEKKFWELVKVGYRFRYRRNKIWTLATSELAEKKFWVLTLGSYRFRNHRNETWELALVNYHFRTYRKEILGTIPSWLPGLKSKKVNFGNQY